MEGLVQLLARVAGPAIGAADRRLQPIAQGALVTGQAGHLHVPNGAGRAEEPFGGDAGQLGQDLVGQGRVRDRLAVVLEIHRPLGSGERLLQRPGADAGLFILVELDGHDRLGALGRIPRAE